MPIKPTPRRPQSPIIPPQANIFRGALKESSPWAKVKPYLPKLKARAGRDDDEFELEIKRLCVIIEVRMRELFGMAELYHSRYYADEQIIQAIARFLDSEKVTRPTSIL